MIRINDDMALAEHEVSYHFVTSSGPGGQNVNKFATAAQLRFDAGASTSLPDEVIRRLRGVAGRRMSAAGVVTIKAQRFRSQERNREDALDRLVRMLRRSGEAPRARRATGPSRAAVARRLADKTRRSRTKRERGPLDPEA
jgi:ribosome-associated protein